MQGGPGLTYQSLCVEAQDGNETKSWFYALLVFIAGRSLISVTEIEQPAGQGHLKIVPTAGDKKAAIFVAASEYLGAAIGCDYAACLVASSCA